MSPTNEELAARVEQLEREVENVKTALKELFEPADPLMAAFARFRALNEAKRKASSTTRRRA